MGRDSFWRGTWSRLPFVLIATILAGIATLSVDTAPATALGPPVLLFVTVSPTAVSVPAGETQQFTATGHYSDLSTQNLTDTVTWSTSSGSTATISNASGSQGLATAVGTGLATITAAVGSDSGTAALTVLPAVLVAITVSPAATSIPLGETAPFNAKGTLLRREQRQPDQVGHLEYLDRDRRHRLERHRISRRRHRDGHRPRHHHRNRPDHLDWRDVGSDGAARGAIGDHCLASCVSTPGRRGCVLHSLRALLGRLDGNITNSVTWSSSDTAAATVSNAPDLKGK